MKVNVLGEWGAYPAAGDATSSFLFEKDGFYLLVDCGSGVLSQLQKVIPLHRLNACILSHYHHDHKADVGSLQYGMLVQTQLGNRTEPLPIYGHAKDAQQFESLKMESYTTNVEINEDTTAKVGPFTITFCKTIHPVYCLAMKIQTGDHTIVYTADTGWYDGLAQFSAGADLLISEASLYNQQLGKVNGHLTAGQTGELAKKANVRKLLMTHLPHYGDHQSLIGQAKEIYRGEIELAKGGMVIEI
ncbi:hypothetical protein CU633_19335 [Bacillus sp. V3-13]|uniref:MBL fold metallo-hydrolase n=1 Tax=Bacillus sp. V3-13 TaxID=2053728 RepID=UPI000C79145A|nr:MBL fold metallo-hydrolase [Bacillus sp. V3-13]PLR75754.1 hypothetical protein CU633_19335 [Bacillus sp. V3-13]